MEETANILRWTVKNEETPPPAPKWPAQPTGKLSALRRWAIRRLLRSECPGYAEQADQFPQAELGLLVMLAIDEPEVQMKVLHEETDPVTGTVFQKLHRPTLAPTPRPENLWCQL